MIRRLAMVVGCAALAAGTFAGAVAREARPHKTTITCANPASGAHWQVDIDFDKATVDSNPAHITDADISWHDASDGANYTLERRSGALTMANASSTGGYLLYDRCTPEKSP